MSHRMGKNVSLFKTPEGEIQYFTAYDRVLAYWPVPFDAVEVTTRFGATHVIVSGPQDALPLVLLHGNFASATMWQPNITDLSSQRRVYVVDIIGNLGKSRVIYQPRTRLDYAEWLVEVFCQLTLNQAAVAGLSYGGFLALNLALYAPRHVTHLILLSPDLPLAPLTFTGLVYGAAMMLMPSRWTVNRFLQQTSVRGYDVNDPYLEQRLIGNTQVETKVI